MAGTSRGGKLAAVTNKSKHGDDFYSKIGKLGGSRSSTGGFASEKVGNDGLTGRQRASLAGRVGGLKSRKNHETLDDYMLQYERPRRLFSNLIRRRK